jgi:two-component system sensor histidine kinase SenX3
MVRPFSSRALVAICGALVILLAALAVVQYRWSTRVAAADAQREREHLDSAASLFAAEFNNLAGQAVEFLQSDARAALKADKPLASVPKLIGELYYVTIPSPGQPQARRLAPGGLFESAPLPGWFPIPACAPLAVEQPPAIITPIFEVPPAAAAAGHEVRFVRRFSGGPDRCFVARLDQDYLRDTLFPQLIRKSFGETAAREYDFAVVSRSRPREALFGSPSRADLQKAFFSIAPDRLTPARERSAQARRPGSGNAIVVQHVETIVTKGPARLAGLFGPGIWELQIAHKGLPLAAAFERTRRLDLLLSLGVEVLLVAAIVFLVIAARRMQRLADQKMQFVAGVSHELRTPVSAIAMLSRNQADGLVTGAGRVKQYGELIHQQSRRLNEMVEQALQYAGIHSGLRRSDHNEIDVCRLIQEALDARREELSRDGFEIEVALSPNLPPVLGDPKLLRIAFDNLLTNAQKYAVGGRWIRVSAEYSAPDKEIRIRVEDRGPGIHPTDQAEIFEPFSRGRGAIEAQIPGSGLGLSLVRSAAEAHRGSVTVVSEPGRGSAFTLHLPV